MIFFIKVVVHYARVDVLHARKNYMKVAREYSWMMENGPIDFVRHINRLADHNIWPKRYIAHHIHAWDNSHSTILSQDKAQNSAWIEYIVGNMTT
jgi:hypothetical protein